MPLHVYSETMSLSAEALQRYARHLVLPQVGREGQSRLAERSALVVGLGGLGSPAALYLAAAGVGRLGIVDDDVVSVSNLQRQVLHGTAAIGAPKTDSARTRLEDLNPLVRIESWEMRLTRDNARGIFADYDVILDGTDHFATRYLVNDAALLEGKPNVHASVHRFEGQLSVFGMPDGPCYRCLHPEPPPPGSVPNCADGGVLGVLPGMLGAMQAAEALKLLLGIGTPMVGRLLVVETLSMRFREIGFDRDPGCAWCGATRPQELLGDYAAFCGEQTGGDTMQDGDAEGSATAVTPAALAMRMARGDALIVLDVREDWERAVASIEGTRSVPMQTIPAAALTLDKGAEIVVVCHHGVRSAMVADYLRSSGFSRVLNLEGGIDRWSVEVDPSVPRY